jgi:hypothetical protein
LRKKKKLQEDHNSLRMVGKLEEEEVKEEEAQSS